MKSNTNTNPNMNSIIIIRLQCKFKFKSQNLTHAQMWSYEWRYKNKSKHDQIPLEQESELKRQIRQATCQFRTSTPLHTKPYVLLWLRWVALFSWHSWSSSLQLNGFCVKFMWILTTRWAHSSAARICPLTMQWLRPAPANVWALRQFSFLDSKYNKPSVDVTLTRF